jgi:hypothetical protein
MLMARFTDVKVLPSPGTALVTMMRLPLRTRVAPALDALAISGRLMIRNSLAMRECGWSGVTNPSWAS